MTARRGRSFVYARVSPKPKLGDTTVEDQIPICVADSERDGYEVVEIFADRRISATKPNKPRPDFERMISSLDRLEPGDRVYVWSPDRFIRMPSDLERLVPMFRRRKLTVHAHEAGSYDLSTDDGLFNARIWGAIAARETALKSSRVRLKLDGNVEVGKSSGGGRAFGFTVGNHDVDPEEADIVREVVKRFLDGTDGINGIAQDLNRRGIRTPRGNLWTNTALREVIRNPRIAGIRTATDRVEDDEGNVTRGTRREVCSATWEAIVSVDDFRRVEAVLEGRRMERGRPPRILTGLLVCGRCGVRMVASRKSKSQGGHRVYICNRRSTNGVGCYGNTILAEPVEDLLIPVFLRFARGWRSSPQDPRVDEANRELEQIRSRRIALATRFADEDDEFLETVLRDLKDRERKAQAIIRSAVEASSSAMTDLVDGNLDEKWIDWSESGNVDAQRRALSLFVESVEIGPWNPSVKGFDPDRIGRPVFRGEVCQGVSEMD